MKTFFNILQTIRHGDKSDTIRVYPCDPFIETQNQNLDQYASHLINMTHYYSQRQIHPPFVNAKFAALSYFLDNTFNSDEFKDAIFSRFSAAQRHYHAFSRFAHIYKVKRCPVVVDTNMALNRISPNDASTFILIDGNSKYYFCLNDLVAIVEAAIGNTSDFFVDAMWPTNPYNNQKLTHAVLYNLYFKLKSATRLMSSLFHFFFLEGFNLETFSEKYEAQIRKRGIHQAAYNAPPITIYYDVMAMLKANFYTKNYNIHKDVPKKTVVDIFRPFLYCYLMTNYYIKGTEEVTNYKQILFCKLKKFYQHNKIFGRKTIKLTNKCGDLTNKPKLIRETTYNLEHLSFHNIKLTEEDYNEYYNQRRSGVLYNMVVQQPNNVTTQITVLDEWQISDNDESSSYENDDGSVS